jgi:hypothetical protein
VFRKATGFSAQVKKNFDGLFPPQILQFPATDHSTDTTWRTKFAPALQRAAAPVTHDTRLFGARLRRSGHVRLQNLTKKQFHEDLPGTSGADVICESSKTMRGRKAWVVAGKGLLLLCAHHFLTRRGVGRDFVMREIVQFSEN